MYQRDHLLQIFNSALAAVDPYAAVRRFVQRDGDTLTLATQPSHAVNLSDYERIWVLGAGKATAPMAQAIEELIEDVLTGGLIVVKYDHALPLRTIEYREAGHPVPDENGLRAGDALLKMAEAATERDLVICLLSGGGSALLESLPSPLTLEDLQATTQMLLASGASIVDVNTIRKHLSRVKGGRLAQVISPASLITLVLSDVVGSPLTAIASGPTVPDSSTWAEVAEILMYFEMMPYLSPAVRAYVEAGIRGDIPDTPKQLPASPTVIIGDNALATDAAFTAAHALGYHTTIQSIALEGEARETGKQIARDALTVQQNNYPLPACLIYGGETTVTLGTTYGKGGRNQELALAAAVELTHHPGITLGAFATDGSDGPTDSAGAIVDGGTVTRGGGMGIARQHLMTHNAYSFLEVSGDLLRTGPTRTNVNDLIVVIVEDR
jgi:glycerate 2-kinase